MTDPTPDEIRAMVDADRDLWDRDTRGERWEHEANASASRLLPILETECERLWAREARLLALLDEHR